MTKHVPKPLPTPEPIVDGRDVGEITGRLNAYELHLKTRGRKRGIAFSLASVATLFGALFGSWQVVQAQTEKQVDAGIAVHEQRIRILETQASHLETKMNAVDDKLDRVLDVLDDRLPQKKKKKDGTP